MFFVLSKTLNYLTMPLVIICILLLLSFLLKSKIWKARLFKIALGLLWFFTNDFIANEVVRAWEIPATPFANIKKKYEYGIVLTGVGKSEMEPADRVYLGRGADRVTHTLQLYKLGIIKKILIAGGNGKLTKVQKQEADVLADVFKLIGAPDSVLVIENNSRNTHETAVEFNKRFKGTIKPEQCILVTSSFHMRRSIACFIHEGWTMDTFSTDFLSHNRKFSFDTLFIPKEEALGNWQIIIREWVGMVAYKLAGYI